MDELGEVKKRLAEIETEFRLLRAWVSTYWGFTVARDKEGNKVVLTFTGAYPKYVVDLVKGCVCRREGCAHGAGECRNKAAMSREPYCYTCMPEAPVYGVEYRR